MTKLDSIRSQLEEAFSERRWQDVIILGRQALVSATEDDDWYAVRVLLTSGLMLTESSGLAENIEEVIRIYEEMLERLSSDELIDRRASTSMNLGYAYLKRRQGDRKDNLRKVVKYYEEAIGIMSWDDRALWASLHVQAGFAHSELARLYRENEHKALALQHFRTALEVFTDSDYPEDHVEVLEAIERTVTFKPNNIRLLREILPLSTEDYHGLWEVRHRLHDLFPDWDDASLREFAAGIVGYLIERSWIALFVGELRTNDVRRLSPQEVTRVLGDPTSWDDPQDDINNFIITSTPEGKTFFEKLPVDDT